MSSIHNEIAGAISTSICNIFNEIAQAISTKSMVIVLYILSAEVLS